MNRMNGMILLTFNNSMFAMNVVNEKTAINVKILMNAGNVINFIGVMIFSIYIYMPNLVKVINGEHV